MSIVTFDASYFESSVISKGMFSSNTSSFMLISFILYLIMLANFICFKFDGIRFNIIGFMFTMIILTISGVFTAINFSKFWNIFHDIIFGDKNMLFFSDSSIMINVCTYGMDKAFIFTSILLYIILSILVIGMIKKFYQLSTKNC